MAQAGRPNGHGMRSGGEPDGPSAFDGAPDSIAGIEVQYRRSTKIRPGWKPEDAEWEYVTWNYNERLTIDGASETMTLEREIGSGCKVTNIYHVEEGVTALLDEMDLDALSEVEGNPPDAVDDPLETKDYVITVFTKRGNTRAVRGSFDKHGLPADWPGFIEAVFQFMRFYGLGEIFDERIYGRAKRRHADYIFCNVEFGDGGRTYCYLADSDNYEEGDLVVVPAGPDNREAVVRIDSIEYHSEEDAPFPLEKTKRILRKYEPGDDDE